MQLGLIQQHNWREVLALLRCTQQAHLQGLRKQLDSANCLMRSSEILEALDFVEICEIALAADVSLSCCLEHCSLPTHAMSFAVTPPAKKRIGNLTSQPEVHKRYSDSTQKKQRERWETQRVRQLLTAWRLALRQLGRRTRVTVSGFRGGSSDSGVIRGSRQGLRGRSPCCSC